MANTDDINLLKFETYEDYLKSYTTRDEYKYVGNSGAIRALVKLGYRTNTSVCEEDDFNRKRKNLLTLLNPKTETTLCSSNLVGNDPALLALAKREEPNLCKKLSTIIFLQMRQRSGFDISGYIDYAASLHDYNRNEKGASDWRAIFEGSQLLRPSRTNLSFYNCQTLKVNFQHSENYEIVHVGTSIVFKHIGDHKMIDPMGLDNTANAKRSTYISPVYGCVVLYDHVVRKAT